MFCTLWLRLKCFALWIKKHPKIALQGAFLIMKYINELSETSVSKKYSYLGLDSISIANDNGVQFSLLVRIKVIVFVSRRNKT